MSITQVEIPQETDMEFKHKSVLLNETIDGLRVKPDGIYVDGTLGGADTPQRCVRNFLPRGDLLA